MTTEQEYIRGFNHGYLLTKHVPELVAKLLSGIRTTANEYLLGFVSGKEEYEIERNRSQEINELDALRDRSHGREQDREKE
jgi:hypothetical protein